MGYHVVVLKIRTVWDAQDLWKSSCYPLMLLKSLQFMEDQVPDLQMSGLNKWVGSSWIASEMP